MKNSIKYILIITLLFSSLFSEINFNRLTKLLHSGLTNIKATEYVKAYSNYSIALSILNDNMNLIDPSGSKGGALEKVMFDRDFQTLDVNLNNILAECEDSYFNQMQNSTLEKMVILKVALEKTIYLLQRGNTELVNEDYCRLKDKYEGILSVSVRWHYPKDFWLTNIDFNLIFSVDFSFDTLKDVYLKSNDLWSKLTFDGDYSFDYPFQQVGLVTNKVILKVEDNFGSDYLFEMTNGVDFTAPKIIIDKIYTNTIGNFVVAGQVVDSESWVASLEFIVGAETIKQVNTNRFSINISNQQISNIIIKAFNFAGLEQVTNIYLAGGYVREKKVINEKEITTALIADNEILKNDNVNVKLLLTNKISITNFVVITNVVVMTNRVEVHIEKKEKTLKVGIKDKQESVKFYLSNIYFDKGSAMLSLFYKKVLKEIADLFKLRKFDKLIIRGYADNEGDREFNNKLSLARAKAVADILIKTKVVPSYKITVRGVGSKESIAPNRTSKGRAKNRRVELMLSDFLK